MKNKQWLLLITAFQINISGLSTSYREKKNSTLFKLPINIHTDDIREFAGTSNYHRAHKHTAEESPPNLQRLASWKTQEGAEA